MKKTSVKLSDLPLLHTQLLWRDLRLSAVAVLSERVVKRRLSFDLSIREVPGFADDSLRINIDTGRIRQAELMRVRRTYELPRLIEFADIAIAGLGLYYAGGHQIVNVAWRGSGADYLIGEERYPLEIAGRSRR